MSFWIYSWFVFLINTLVLIFGDIFLDKLAIFHFLSEIFDVLMFWWVVGDGQLNLIDGWHLGGVMGYIIDQF